MYNILIVDDDKLIRWSLRELFSQEGYNVDAVSSTEEALEQVKSCSYNLIFSDLKINDENCYGMIRKMASFQPEAKIIIISALNAGQIKSRLSDKSVYSIVEKPFKGDQIRSIAKRALEKTFDKKRDFYQKKNEKDNEPFIKIKKRRAS